MKADKIRDSLTLALGLFALASCEVDSSVFSPSRAHDAATEEPTQDAATEPTEAGPTSVDSSDAADVSMPLPGADAADVSMPGASVSAPLAVGPFASCLIDDQTNVHCFGMCGPSGQGGMRNAAPAGLKARAVTVGRAFACALLAQPQDGAVVRCWGGDPAGATPKIADADEIAAAEAHACVRSAGGQVTCWGTVSSDAGAAPAVPTGLVAKRLAVSGSMDCAIMTDDGVRCWGARPVAPPADLKAKRIAVSTQLADPTGGPRYGCAVTLADDVRCWGDNPGGVQTVPPGTKAKDVAVGGSAACAILLDDRVTCWGTAPRYGVKSPDGRKATALSMAFRTAGAVLDDHSFAVWGDTGDGRGAVPAGVRAP
jgi:hypothetical protein